MEKQIHGIQIRNTLNHKITDSTVNETMACEERWGDGLEIINSEGLVKDSQFSANHRYNIILYNSEGSIENNTITYGLFGIALEEGTAPELNNNFMFGNGEDIYIVGR
jgi:parallel beta-helix repeat protein